MFPHFVLLFCLTVFVSPAHSEKVYVPDDLIDGLFKKISDLQAPEDEPLVSLLQPYRQKGVYKSSVKLYFHGGQDMAQARRLIDVYDNNMFATIWISSTLIESYRYGQAPRPTEEQLMLAIESLEQYVDRNKPYNNSLMFFWPTTFNVSTQFWQATPINVLALINESANFSIDDVITMMDLLGLTNVTEYIRNIVKTRDRYLQVFHLCPDMDDTFLNMGLGALLYQMRNDFPQSSKLWTSDHSNLTSIFDALKRYAYRPFQNGSDPIDPRTYLYLRSFLDQAKASGNDVAVVSTWVQNLEELQTEFKKGVSMPLNVNNVDVAVCANTIFGITSAILSGLVRPSVLEDPLIAQIYHNSSALVAYEIHTNLSNRPDLALLYYPSRMEFYWFVSRTVALLDAARAQEQLPVPVMEEVLDMLEEAAKTNMTSFILSQARHDEQDGIYFDDFLGDGDLTSDGLPLERGEDRIFTTAMAVNTLLYTWSDFNETAQISKWKSDVPLKVKQTVSGCVRWLTEHTLDDNYDWNAFFSGSTKGSTSVITKYPSNVFQFTNGTTKTRSQGYNQITDTVATQGYIPPLEYDNLLKNMSTPLVFNGYNDVNGYFIYWSSDAYTYTSVILALSRYNLTED